MVLKSQFLVNLDFTKINKDRQLVNHVWRELFVEQEVCQLEKRVLKVIIAPKLIIKDQNSLFLVQLVNFLNLLVSKVKINVLIAHLDNSVISQV